MSDDTQKQIDEIKLQMTKHDQVLAWEKWVSWFGVILLCIIMSLSMYQCSLKNSIDTKVTALIAELNPTPIPTVVVTPTPTPIVTE